MRVTARIYYLSWKGCRKVSRLLNACYVGFWLGVLGRKSLHEVDMLYYNEHEKYRNRGYNQSGLWDWEAEAVRNFFGSTGPILVTSAGGGREVLALLKLGYSVDGIECVANLVSAANQILIEEGYSPSITYLQPDGLPEGKSYAGIIIGWGAYMLTTGKRARVDYLRRLRKLLLPGGPLLLSFYFREQDDARFKVICTVGNLFRGLTGRERLELGDDLCPEYVHYFSRKQLEEELAAGGFQLVHLDTSGYANGVAMATDDDIETQHGE